MSSDSSLSVSLLFDLSAPHGFAPSPQNVVPDLSYTVRSPVLDSWEGIKQLKAALWALVSTTCVILDSSAPLPGGLLILLRSVNCFQGNISSSTWGLNLLLEENVIPDIVALAQHCEVLSVRG